VYGTALVDVRQIEGMIVNEDDEDVWPPGDCLRSLGATLQAKSEADHQRQRNHPISPIHEM
jgi:hypothetical protein